jgi:glycosyltransferase involved in cell wall biosynthesis
MPPSVDITIPAYRPRFFEQALRSAIGQSHPDIKIHVSDNCPTDEIENICKKYPKDLVSYVRNPITGAKNYEHSFGLGTAPIIKPLFDDDVLQPFCIERMLAKGGRHLLEGKASFIFSASEVVDTKNRRYTLRRPFQQDRVIRGREFRERCLGNLTNFVGEFSTIMFGRANLPSPGSEKLFSWKDVNAYDGLPDVAFFLNAVENAPCIYIDEVLSYFRYAEDHDSDSNQKLNKNGVLFTRWFDFFEAWPSAERKKSVINVQNIEMLVENMKNIFFDDERLISRCQDFLSKLNNRI